MKYIIIVVLILILILAFKNWWENNWRSYYGEGIRKLRANDYHGASQQLFKAKLKNKSNWQISYYCGLADKHVSDRMNSREAIEVKKFAISCFIDALILNPSHLKSNNMIEMILSDEEDVSVLKELIKDTRNKLEKTSDKIRNQFMYLDKIDKIIKKDSEKMGFKGDVKLIKEEEFFIVLKEGNIVSGNYESGRYFEFNKTGKLIKSSGCGGEGSWGIELTYDNQGYRINEGEESFKYDKRGNIIECIYNGNPYFSKTVFKFDKDGNKLEEIRYKLNGKEDWKWVFRYDIRNRLVEKVNYASNSIGIHKIKFEYNHDGNKHKCKLYLFDESLHGEFIYDYDNYGNSLNNYSEDFFNNPIIIKRTLDYFNYIKFYS